MQKYEFNTQFSYINEKQFEVCCCALALGMEDFNIKEMFDSPTSKNSKQLLQKNLVFLNSFEARTLARSLIKTVENILESISKSSIDPTIDFTDFYLLENYLSKFHYFYLTYRCQEIVEDNRHINFMNARSSNINNVALISLTLFTEISHR
jgi:hypothetical protein